MQPQPLQQEQQQEQQQQQQQQPTYKFNEVVRGRAARDALPAFSCHACRAWYEAIHSWGASQGGLPEPVRPRCGHQDALPRGLPGADQILQHVSRHRARFARPETQDGYWDLGFMDSLDSRYVEQQQVAAQHNRQRAEQQEAEDGDMQHLPDPLPLA
jgi:hypothetical protein